MVKKHLFINGIINASYLMVGNIISQIINILAFVYIAKKLGPENFGIYSTITAFVGIFSVFTLNGLSKSLIREGAKNLLRFSDILENTFGIKLFAVIFSLIICNIVAYFTHYNYQTKLLIVLFSLELLEIGFSSFLSTIFQVIEKMKYLAFFSIISKILFSFLSILLLYLGYSVIAVLLSHLASRFIILIINFLISKKHIYVRFRPSFKIDRHILKSGIIFTMIGFINTLATRIDIIMISFLSTSADVGLYSVPYKVVLEGEIIRGLLSTAFFPIFVKTSKKEKSLCLIFKYSSLLLVSMLTACLIFSYFAKDIVTLIFGEEFYESGNILRFLVFALVFSYYTIPLTLTLQSTDREKSLLLNSFAIAILNIPLNFIFFHKFGLIGIAYSTLIVYLSSAVFLSIITYKSISKKSNKPFIYAP